ncbi:hypothetical protein QYF48_16180 [Brevibacillus agri]|uniref:hypothetical protein n=1 Tax=Brevibacillus agri TaxID=51101 RepID=UPI0025B64010|nr:hypothetical protein [Brevibacillus agri]MDN4094347.1 hypothetical protein [Brevibacillus agri]
MAIVKKGSGSTYAIGAYEILKYSNLNPILIGETSSEGLKISVEYEYKEILGANKQVIGYYRVATTGTVEGKLVTWNNETLATIALPGQSHVINSSGKSRITIQDKQEDLMDYCEKYLLRRKDLDPEDPDFDEIILHHAVNVENFSLDLKPDAETTVPLKFRCFNDGPERNLITFGDETIAIPEV